MTLAFPLTRFLNQTVTYQAFVSANQRDDPTYATSATVAARYVEVDRERYSKDEEQHVAHTRLWLGFQPPLKSLIDGREVISVSALVQVNGANPGWSVELR